MHGNGGGEAKFTEYRDLRESGGLYGRARLNYDTDKYFMNFNARDFGYDTQKYELEGGMWGKFKYDLSYEEIPHNMTFDAKTFFVGAGDYTLIGAPNTNVATWNTFDYSIERRQFGAGFKAEHVQTVLPRCLISTGGKEGDQTQRHCGNVSQRDWR